MPDFSNISKPEGATGLILLDSGQVIWGHGFGAETETIGEICFNTSMSGYQESLTDPSFASQIITFTFPHIGNVGANAEDIETRGIAANGLIVRENITTPANWRADQHFDEWLSSRGIVGISGVDTRALTKMIRDEGAPRGLIAFNSKGEFNLHKLLTDLQSWSGLEGLDLAGTVTCKEPYEWDQSLWSLTDGYSKTEKPKKHVVAIDYGAKHNILRCLSNTGCKVTVVPCTMPANDILALKPDGIFLSNGPGDPAATGEYAIPIIQDLIKSGKPIFGICLGHQLLALSLGGKTEKMHLGHRGANHPVQDLETGKVEITSQNHGFKVIPESLPDDVVITHKSLFDDSNEGLKSKDKPLFSVQYHPEASPGPMDSYYLFERFTNMINKAA